MANALQHETSPYLRQHRSNPVDWHPWGERALELARESDRPLLVSIGYSACHWCHVMERESFEDEATAAVMNEHFVCVKVDREERPDVDAIYMEAVQGMTGQGGWPLNVFLTPDQEPFYGGTYFPPDARQGMPSWRQVLLAVADAWSSRRDEIRTQSAQLRERLSGAALLEPSGEPVEAAVLDAAVETLRSMYDPAYGGWGGAPKFPAASTIEFLLARGERDMALETLRAMAAGGIHDQVGGGFARYSVDRFWTVPHFEKMLYDNALLARAYLHGWQVSGDNALLGVARRTLDWMLRELRTAEGAFASALDADSEGVEGRFYVWTEASLREALDPADADAAISWFGVTPEGNFEGDSILEGRGPEPDAATAGRIRARLLEVRSQRVWPGLDDKVLTSWNALAISALADAGAVLGDERYLDAARDCARFLLEVHRDDGPDRHLLRTSKDGDARLNAYLEDHAFLVEALVTLYEATFQPTWLAEARALADTMIARFADAGRGGFFFTSSDHEQLVARRKDLEDTPIPAGASSAALGLLRLHALTGEGAYAEHAAGTLALVHEIAPRHPTAFGHLLQAMDWLLGPVREVAIAGPDPEPMARAVRATLRPRLVLAGGEGDVPLLEGRTPVDGQTAAYVCEHFACRAPITDVDALVAALED